MWKLPIVLTNWPHKQLFLAHMTLLMVRCQNPWTGISTFVSHYETIPPPDISKIRNYRRSITRQATLTQICQTKSIYQMRLWTREQWTMGTRRDDPFPRFRRTQAATMISIGKQDTRESDVVIGAPWPTGYNSLPCEYCVQVWYTAPP